MRTVGTTKDAAVVEQFVMSSAQTDGVTPGGWSVPRGKPLPDHWDLLRPRLRLRLPRDEKRDASVEIGFRFATVQVGYWLGWASIVVVLAGLASVSSS